MSLFHIPIITTIIVEKYNIMKITMVIEVGTTTTKAKAKAPLSRHRRRHHHLPCHPSMVLKGRWYITS